MDTQSFFPQRPDAVPTIYAYRLVGVDSHKGYLKIGYTDRDAETRVKEQTSQTRVPYEIVLQDSAMCNDGSCFMDHDVHALLKKQGFRQLNAGEDKNEWFKCTVQDVMAAIVALQTGTANIEKRTQTFGMRPEQERAVMMTEGYFRQQKIDEPDRTPKFLWNAKMRFGKTFASYQLAKRMGFKRILILTFKPAVESAWRDDLVSHVDFQGWQFISNKDAKNNSLNIDQEYARADKSKPIVVFGSFQDMLGTGEGGGIKAKNEFIHTVSWDIVIFDEYHFGAWRERAKDLFEKEDEEAAVEFDAEKYQNDEAGNAINESWLPISTSHYLYLSGTPFRAINSGEFIEEQIFNWTYSDEQDAKKNWDSSRGHNPYLALPQMVMLTYKMPDQITEIAKGGEFDEFDLNEFFRAEKGTDVFIHEEYVQKWLDLIRGANDALLNLKLGNEKPPMPYSDVDLLNYLGHTYWFLPSVASCDAMEKLLAKPCNSFYHAYKVVNASGNKAGMGADALKPVLTAMGNPDPQQTRTITLSFGKLSTGVTVRPWTGILMLRNTTSPETYFQAAFRVQSPWTLKDEYGKEVVLKPICYIFDFAPNRALRQVDDYSCNLNVTLHNPEEKVAEFIKFLPILAYDGSSMRPIDAGEVLDMAMSGTTATLLARRWESAILVNVDNGTLQKLLNNPEALRALMNIEGFRTLNQDIETNINKSEHVKNTKKQKGENLTPKEKKELSDEEKEYRSKRKEIQEKLIKFATRIPVFIDRKSVV